MTTAVGDDALTLTDLAKRMDPNGKVARIIEMLNERNEILTDMMWKEGNLQTGHQTTIRTGLPDVYFRLLNQGVPSSKSRTAQVTEGTAILEARSEVDVKLAQLSSDIGGFRLSESRPFIEAMNQTLADTLFYGNTTVNPERFNGLAVRYSDPTAVNGENVLDAGGSQSDNTSIYLVVWDEQTVHGIYPKGTQAGLQHDDLGIGDAFDGDNNRFRAYMDRWEWNPGLVVKDWRFVVRIGSIDVSNLIAESSAADLIKLMIKAYHRIPTFNMGKAAWYMNRTVFQMLDIQRMSAVSTGGGITYDNVDGKLIPAFRGIPIRRVDAIHNDETAV